MLRFACQHCGRPVRAEESAAGRLGRCSLCDGVVLIPAEPRHATQGGTEAKLVAAARRASRAEQEQTLIAPSDSTAGALLDDESDITPPEERPFEKTDILPALRGQSDSPPQTMSLPADQKGRGRLVLAATVSGIILAGLAAIALLLLATGAI